jgi:hypothetical protein
MMCSLIPSVTSLDVVVFTPWVEMMPLYFSSGWLRWCWGSLPWCLLPMSPVDSLRVPLRTCLVVSIGVVTLSSSFRRSWPIMMAFRRSLSPCGLHVLIYRVVIPCYDFHSRWSTTFVTCLGVGCHRVWCDQHCLRLRCEVVHLRCQLCICHNSHIAVLLTPIKYVRVSQFVGILLDAVTTY